MIGSKSVQTKERGKQKRGRPKKTWNEQMKNAMEVRREKRERAKKCPTVERVERFLEKKNNPITTLQLTAEEFDGLHM